MMPIRRQASKLTEALVWYHFVPAGGADGAAWYEEYLGCGGEQMGQRLDVAVAMLRQRRLSEGRALLDECRQRMDALGAQRVSASVRGAVEESYWASQAYAHYHLNEFEAARKALAEGQRLLASVLEDAPFLVMFATRCYDFCLHLARIARNERRWDAMWSHIQEGREMVRGERALCQLSQRGVYIQDAEAFLSTVSAQDVIEVEALQVLLDRERTLHLFERRALGATLIPNVILQY
ncbi:hypothetical protein [Corallococcus caeni]|uniref:Uncharacterized protein n=1 Tax=Corallococcus caeni TaxID=3082388 RepID=A0ABQ6QXF5_9BACT|nr:hypothetical protein ASNO1_42460 [Corallococcus sp. NO1]